MKKLNHLMEESLNFITKAEKSSQQILAFVRNGNIEKLDNDIENRERLISAVMSIYEEIEKYINDDHFIKGLNKIDLSNIRNWSDKLFYFIGQIRNFDAELLKSLENHKSDASKELAQLFKFKQKFKGYNLNDLRK